MEVKPEAHISKKVFFSTLANTMSSVMFGISLTIIRSSEEIIKEEWKKTESDSEIQKMWGVCCANIFAGCLISNILINLIKPKKRNTLIFNGLIYVAGYILPLLKQEFYYVFVSRLIIGFASGISCAIVPASICSIAPTKHRGFLSSFHSLGIILGITIGHVMAWCNTEAFWRIPIYIAMGTSLLTSVALMGAIDPMDDSSSSGGSVFALLSRPKAFKSLFLAILLHVGQHLSGVDYVTIYSSTVFERNYSNANLVVVLVSIFAVITVFISSRYMDSLGRKPLIMLSALMCGIATAMFANNLYPVAGALLFMGGYNVGLSSIPWFITSEIFPTKFAEAAGLLAVSLNWISAYFSLFALYPLHQKYPAAPYYFYSASMAGFMVIIWLLFTETMGRIPNFQ